MTFDDARAVLEAGGFARWEGMTGYYRILSRIREDDTVESAVVELNADHEMIRPRVVFTENERQRSDWGQPNFGPNR